MPEDDKSKIVRALLASEISAGAAFIIPAVSATGGVTGAKDIAIRSYPPVLDLPKPVLERVAAIAVHWAYAEYLLAGMQYSVHLLDRKAGRDYSVEPRLKAVTEDVTKLGKHRGLTFPFPEWETFTGTLTECDKTRNQLLHAVWFYNEDAQLCIQDIKGEWPKDEAGKVYGKKQRPGMILIDEAWLDTKLQRIQAAIEDIKRFSRLLDEAVKAWLRR